MAAEAPEDGVPRADKDPTFVLTRIGVHIWYTEKAYAELGHRKVGTVDGGVVTSEAPPAAA